MKVTSESEIAQLCLTLSDPMDSSLPGSSIHGIFQARALEWGATAFSAKIHYWHPNPSLRACFWEYHQLGGHEFELALEVGDGQESLVSSSPWGIEESDMTE